MESNHQPPLYESGALPIELRWREGFMIGGLSRGVKPTRRVQCFAATSLRLQCGLRVNHPESRVGQCFQISFDAPEASVNRAACKSDRALCRTRLIPDQDEPFPPAKSLVITDANGR